MKMTSGAIRFAATVIALFAFASFDAAAEGDAGDFNHYILSCEHQCTGRWTLTGSLSIARQNHTATLLGNGKVLVAGGSDDNGAVLTSAELYDPATGRWSVTRSMNRPRAGHFAFLLPGGRVLVIGGDQPCCMSNVTAELFDPDTGSWNPAGDPGRPFVFFKATMLPSGKVLLLPGVSPLLYDPLQQTWTVATGIQVSGAPVYRQWPDTALLPDGRVLVTGGSQDVDCWVVAPGADLYNPTTGVWDAAGAPSVPRLSDTATILADGSVLAAGGTTSIIDPRSPQGLPTGDVVLLRSSEVYGPDGAWHQVGDLNAARSYHTATLLPDGRLVAAGGLSSEIQINPPWPLMTLRSAEVYDPTTALWTYTADLNIARGGHTATLLNDGTVLLVGGVSIGYGVLSSAEIYAP